MTVESVPDAGLLVSCICTLWLQCVLSMQISCMS